MANPVDMLLKFIFDNIWIFVILGLGIYFFREYFNFKKKTTYKVVDREEVERLKYIEAMKLNTPPKNAKFLYRGDMKNIYIGNGNGQVKISERWENFIRIGIIQSYLEYEQIPIKTVEKEGIVRYEEEKDEKPMKLIGMVIKPCLFWKIANPFKKAFPVIIENNQDIFREGNKIIIPSAYGFDKLLGYYYMMGESIKPKIRNIHDARILVQDHNLMASRYWAKGQEQAVYSPQVAEQMMQLEKQLQIELAKKRGQQQTL